MSRLGLPELLWINHSLACDGQSNSNFCKDCKLAIYTARPGHHDACKIGYMQIGADSKVAAAEDSVTCQKLQDYRLCCGVPLWCLENAHIAEMTHVMHYIRNLPNIIAYLQPQTS